jgi:hypothetical protein
MLSAFYEDRRFFSDGVDDPPWCGSRSRHRGTRDVAVVDHEAHQYIAEPRATMTMVATTGMATQIMKMSL